MDKTASYHNIMELTYNELKKRDVINIADGRCLGRIINLKLKFPEGRLVGIYVPGRRRRGIFCLFDKSETFIDERRIIKIGGDVILVDVSCHTPPPRKENKPTRCPPQNSHDSRAQRQDGFEGNSDREEDFFNSVASRIDTDDY